MLKVCTPIGADEEADDTEAVTFERGTSVKELKKKYRLKAVVCKNRELPPEYDFPQDPDSEMSSEGIIKETMLYQEVQQEFRKPECTYDREELLKIIQTATS